MTGRLGNAQRLLLEKLVSRCRDLLMADLSDALEGRYGIRPDGTVEAASTMRSLDDTGHSERRDLIAVLEHFAAEGSPGRTGRQRLVREAVFTHLNRLLAIRIAEAHGLLPQSMAAGRDSRGLRDLVSDVAPQLGADDTGGYWAYLSLCGDELAADAPELFDPRNPLLGLAPSPLALDRVIAELQPDYPGETGRSIWSAADTLGWAYQFFNDEGERTEMRRHAPETSRELAVRNQFFTPDYVVGYLVHNTLGRRLLDADPRSGLADELDWLIDPPAEKGAPLELGGVKVLDPACGSGHFLLGAYDVLERAWHHVGVGPGEAAPRILAALWGIEIDPRAAQVAAAAIILRARQACGPGVVLPRPNVICARELPPLPPEVEGALPAGQRQLLAELRQELEHAPLLGSLLKAEGLLGARMVGLSTHPNAGTVPLAVPDEAAGEVRATAADLLEVVHQAAEHATSGAAERLTAAEAGDALRFLTAMSQRYDVVLMNPPFGEPVVGTKAYIKAAYPWIPTKDHNLLAAFVGRGIELCDQHGYVGAITSRAGLFLTTFGPWRTDVLLGHRLVTLADLGFGVMEQALVEAAAYVISPGRGDPSRPVPFLRLLRQPAATRGDALRQAITAARRGTPDDRVFRVAPADFAAIPGSPLAYWLPASIRRLFRHLPPLEGHGAQVRQGLATGDDFRFVRARWEVDPRRIAQDREATRRGRRWVPFAKGGEYSPYWADIHLVVDWENDGARIRSYEGSVIRNQQYYFRPGLTWPRRTASGFGPRIMPAACAFADKGPAIIAAQGELVMLGWLTSRLAGALLAVMLGAADETSSGTASKSYEVGLVANIPWPDQLRAIDGFADLVQAIAATIRSRDLTDETTTSFVAPMRHPVGLGIEYQLEEDVRVTEDGVLRILDDSLVLEEEILGVIGSDAASFVEEEMGTHPAALPEFPIPDLKTLYVEPVGQLIATGVSMRGGLRALSQKTFIADRRLEVLAHTYGANPRCIVDQRRRLGLLPPGAERDAADRVFSYLLGCALGRWDVRMGRDPSLAPRPGDLLEPPAACSPGMLVGRDGFPTADPGPGYPLSIPRDGVLVDEPGHRADVVGAVEAAAAALVDEPSMLVNELIGLLGRGLRDHLRRQFFKDHLSRYSKSRRKAPIYWPLYIPSRSWGVWVYAHRISRETLFSVEAAADQRLGSAITEMRRLEDAQLAAGRGTPRQVAAMLESERRVAEELRRFQREARRIAETGWVPDLDDGMVLCAAPLVELLPDWQTELSTRRAEIKAGRYPWSAVHEHRDAL